MTTFSAGSTPAGLRGTMRTGYISRPKAGQRAACSPLPSAARARLGLCSSSPALGMIALRASALGPAGTAPRPASSVGAGTWQKGSGGSLRRVAQLSAGAGLGVLIIGALGIF